MFQTLSSSSSSPVYLRARLDEASDRIGFTIITTPGGLVVAVWCDVLRFMHYCLVAEIDVAVVLPWADFFTKSSNYTTKCIYVRYLNRFNFQILIANFFSFLLSLLFFLSFLVHSRLFSETSSSAGNNASSKYAPKMP